MGTSTDLLDAAGTELDAAVDLRRRLHRRPELGLDLPETQATVLEELDGLGIELRTGAGVSSVVGILEGDASGPTVLLRADMDALPMPEDTDLDYASVIDGAMHACGHDAHTAMLVGAARLLVERRAQLHGRVVLAFQPGEEGHHGARSMIEEGLLEGDTRPDSAFAIHITPIIPSGMVATRRGPLMASADAVRITITGRGGHASMPHQALDPIPVACEVVQAIQTMVTRQVDAFDPAVLTIAKIEAGTTNNVISESAHLTGTLRAVSARTRQLVLDSLRRLAEGIAAAHGAEAVVDIEEGYPVTVNDAGMAATAAAVATSVVGERAVVEMPAPVMGAEDFSYLLEQVPGAMVFLGAMPSGTRSPAPNHSNRMVLDEAAMAPGIALYSAVALDQLAPAHG
jgi:hippurate hydrolase